jgi:FdhD protein
MGKEKREIISVTKGDATTNPDWLAREWPLTITINSKQYITLLATPENLDELAVGFALGDGLLNNKDDIVSIQVSPDNRQMQLELKGNVDLASRLASTRVLTTGCGKGSGYYRAVDSLKQKPVENGKRMSPELITSVMREFGSSSTLFAETGAVHAAALITDKIVVFREDVARHNAVDKLAGNVILENLDVSKMALMTSGRISSELVLKSARIGIGLLISRSAPTALAVELAEGLGMTLVGFVRGQRFNIYCNTWRVEGI